MRKPTFCICENKGADQLRSYCEADQRLCFRYTVSTIFIVFLNPKFQASCHLTALFLSDLFENHIVGFLMPQIILIRLLLQYSEKNIFDALLHVIVLYPISCNKGPCFNEVEVYATVRYSLSTCSRKISI